MDSLSIRELREKSGELFRQAEAGCLSLVAKHGPPFFVAVRLDEHLLSEGVAVAMACRLFAEGAVSLGKGTRLGSRPSSPASAPWASQPSPTAPMNWTRT